MTSSNLSIEQAAAHDWDAIVIGAGPAGCATALGLARLGHDVLIVERSTFPRFKVCGGCLNRASLTHLDAFGLSDVVHRIGGQPIDRLQWIAGSSQAEVDLPRGVSVSREALDAELAQAAIDAGASFLSGTEARIVAGERATEPKVDDASVFRQVRLTQTDRFVVAGCRILVQATGLGTKSESAKAIDSKSRIGCGAVVPADRSAYTSGAIRMVTGPGGYVGVVGAENNQVSVAAAIDPQLLRCESNMSSAINRILQQSGMSPLENVPADRWKGTPFLTQRPQRVSGHRLFRVGDAAGYVEPFTGEGIAWALAGARSLVPIVDQACRQWSVERSAQWEATHQQTIASQQRVCRNVARLLRKPRLVRGTVRLVSLFPSLAKPVVSRLNSIHSKFPQE